MPVETGAFMIDERVKIKCTKCSQMFREHARKVRNGLQINCAHCNRLITFDTGSEDRNIRRALTNAKEVRHAIEAFRQSQIQAQTQAAHNSAADRSQF
jgi:DNA-directed RNA polymerase subunit RPC12/RpoP